MGKDKLLKDGSSKFPLQPGAPRLEPEEQTKYRGTRAPEGLDLTAANEVKREVRPILFPFQMQLTGRNSDLVNALTEKREQMHTDHEAAQGFDLVVGALKIALEMLAQHLPQRVLVQEQVNGTFTGRLIEEPRDVLVGISVDLPPGTTTIKLSNMTLPFEVGQ